MDVALEELDCELSSQASVVHGRSLQESTVSGLSNRFLPDMWHIVYRS